MKLPPRSLARHALAVLALASLAACAGPASGPMKPHVKHNPKGDPKQRPPAGQVRVTYFGTNSFLLQSREAAVLIDPYFSRVGPVPLLRFNPPVRSDYCRIKEGLDRLPPRADLIVVTHGHFDHLGDVPEVARSTGAKVALSPTGRNLLLAMDVPDRQLIPLLPNDRDPSRNVNGVRVTAFEADHPRILGEVCPGTLCSPPPRGSLKRMCDWKVGEPLAWLIEMSGKRIYVESGGAKVPPPELGRDVDLAIIGVPTGASVRRYPEVVRKLSPKYVLPSHHDNFGRRLTKGFRYQQPWLMWKVTKMHRQQQLPGELILLNYYEPWDLR